MFFKKKKKPEPIVLEIPKEYDDEIIDLSLAIQEIIRDIDLKAALKHRRKLWGIFETIHIEVAEGSWDFEIPVVPSKPITLTKREV